MFLPSIFATAALLPKWDPIHLKSLKYLFNICFRYEFDVTKCMFSAGNITEKLRVAGFDCRGETVVDLYAGEKTLSKLQSFLLGIIYFSRAIKHIKIHLSCVR